MFSSMLYKAFKGGEKIFHVFTDNSLVDPADYEKLAVEMIRFADELKAAIKAQKEAPEAEQSAPAPESSVVVDLPKE